MTPPAYRLACLLVGLAVLVAGAPPALASIAAQTAPSPTPGGARIELAAQDPWTPLGGDLRFRLALSAPGPGSTVSFSAYQALDARKVYDSTMAGGPLVGNLGQVVVAVDAMEVDDTGARVVSVGLQSPTEPRDPERLNLRRPGVYPLVVDLRDADDKTLASFRTAVVVAEADGASVAVPLKVATVWPLSAPPSHLADGEPDPAVVAMLRPEGRLGRLVGSLAAVPDVPVTLAPTGETIEAWETQGRSDITVAAVAAGVRSPSPTRQVLDGTYVPLDLPSLLDHGLGLAVDENLVRGTEALSAVYGTSLDRRTRLARPVSPSALARLRAAGVDRVVVDASAIGPAPEPRFTPAQPVILSAPTGPGGSEPVAALVTDPGLQAFLTADLPDALRAQLVLAGLALVALETPALPRVVTLVAPDDAALSARLVTALLTGLRRNPYLEPVTVAQAFDTVPSEPPAATVTPGAATAHRDLAPTPSAEPLISAFAYQAQRTRLNSFGALTRPGDPAVGLADRSLLASVSAAWPVDIGRARAAAHLAVVDRVIDAFVAKIEVPDPRTITLTSRSGEIPLTFRNDTGAPIRLRAALASAKLFFPHGSVLDLELPPRSTTVRVAVEARTSGTFPLDLEVTSADGVLPISQRRLEVRSTYVSTVGIVLMASAAGFLAVWWGFDLRRRRRRRTRTAES